jgi:hypothetical protein
MRKAALTLFKIALSTVLLYLLFSQVDAGSFWRTLSGVLPWTVLLAMGLFFFTQCVSTLRWRIVLSKDVDVPYNKLFSIYFIGMFFNNFLPTIVGGDVVKGYYLYKATGKGGASVASVFMDRYSGLTALVTITAVALVLGYSRISAIDDDGIIIPAFAAFITVFVAASAFIWINALHGWVVRLLMKVHLMGVNKKIESLYSVFIGYKGYGGLLVKAFSLGLVVQFFVIIGYVAIGYGIGIDLHIGLYFLFVPLATVISMIPITFAGLGVREGVFVYLFTKAGASVEEALGLSLLYFVLMATVSLIGGVEYIRSGGAKGLKLTLPGKA